MIDYLNTDYGLINAIIGLANLLGFFYLLRRKRSVTRRDFENGSAWYDKDGQLINSNRK